MVTFGSGTIVARRLCECVLSVVFSTTLSSCAGPLAVETTQMTSSREDIHVLRSLRVERIAKSTWCSQERAGFAPLKDFLLEDRFTMWSVQVQPQDGRVVNAKVNQVGQLATCFGATSDPKTVNFYAEGQISGLPLAGNGECLMVRPDFPEKGITMYRCYLNLRGLPSPYVGGLLTTNSLISPAVISGESDPVGYVQTSIATLRLWRSK